MVDNLDNLDNLRQVRIQDLADWVCQPRDSQDRSLH